MRQLMCLICALGNFVISHGQETSLFISTGKTTSLIFPYPIRHVDRGTKDVMVQPVKEAGNILLIKAASENFPKTNLSVVTDDGSVYALAVAYGESPTWVYYFPPQVKMPVSAYANSILDNPKTMIGVRDASWDMIARVIGIYIKDEVIFYQLQLSNQSSIDYGVNFLHFYIRDKNKAKRTAVQEAEMKPLYTAGNIKEVKANSENTVVVALDRFTIPDAKYLAIEIGEKNGGRNLLLKINNRKIVKAIILPDLK
jgi:conjugative transposon TraN protein